MPFLHISKTFVHFFCRQRRKVLNFNTSCFSYCLLCGERLLKMHGLGRMDVGDEVAGGDKDEDAGKEGGDVEQEDGGNVELDGHGVDVIGRGIEVY